MFNFNKIKFLKKNNFDVFCIENFLDNKVYEDIKKNLPDLDLNKFSSKFTINGKLGLQPGDGKYEEYILSNQILKNLHDKIFEKKFLKKFMKLFFLRILKSRITDFNYFLKILIRKNKFINYQGYKKTIIDKFLYNHIVASIQYSYMYNNSKIVPHTDSRAKLISLMLYFPDENLSEKNAMSLGTTFYDSKAKNLNNIHLSDEIDEKDFKSKNITALTLPFKPYNLYGFIRNDKSWHTVEKINMHKNFVRKSININLLLDV